MAEVLVQGRESGREGGIAVTHVQRLQTEETFGTIGFSTGEAQI